MLTQEQGQYLVNLARKNIAHFLKTGTALPINGFPTILNEKRGVFVTLKKNEHLRGCIGYPEPVYPLIEALLDSSISAAVRDPRFPPVTASEMETVTVEVTVLTEPTPIKPDPANVTIGKDGLMIEQGMFKGILLPQVPVEWEWDSEEFLCQACIKAGLPPDCWLDKKTVVYAFQGQIFSE
ncbi:MAG: TIGR00296 family protein [Theionarchaea archaeon]|nr:TIGR00296 family protein [Theionarchaea archaeon]MBU7037455.1 TIGR00296 family protein [Theionarchaea archaeon]